LRSLTSTARSLALRFAQRAAAYEGTDGKVWIAGSERRAPSIAPFFAGHDAHPTHSGYVLQGRIPDRVTEVASSGGLAILRLSEVNPRIDDHLRRAIPVPPLVDVTRHLPGDVETLRSDLLTSTTREDFRRIRKAGFTYRVTTDPAVIREFHARHYKPLVAQRFPDDGMIRSAEHMLRDLDRGGELVCADIDGTWVAGISNVASDDRYELQNLGILNADENVRQKRVTAALLIRSLERGVELGKESVSLGRSLPFLGKGPVWFKAKWGGTISRSHVPGNLFMFMDLRHEPVRRMLADSPIIHRLGGDSDIGVATWLDAGEDALKVTVRDAGRFPGITRWHVVGEPDTLAAGADELASNPRIMPIPVTLGGQRPIWLGEVLPPPGELP
jgi:hypothetical protein